MSTERTTNDGGVTPEGITRYGDVIEHDGHAWVLAHDDTQWFYECLKCNDWADVCSIVDMNRAVEHGYAYMPFRVKAPWRTEYPSCLAADAPVPADVRLERGPLVAVKPEE